MSGEPTLYDRLGGMATLERVHKIFYDHLYLHPWLGKFFEGHDQRAIEQRQSQFMAIKFGALDVAYYGKQPRMAHRALYITPEQFELRQQILRQSLQEAGVDEDLIEPWLAIDASFFAQIVKPSIESFYQTHWRFERRVIVPKPEELR
ncbi:MAG: group 1 truncated hemoglobin [Alphaproteobacteria bacterium CG_4_10_14_0_2_um_filter_63_37]|nr:MAG: group 1 truncated hemoglobin [Proteobacteria bacterium CG1_02_64_396]PJA26019.1 MAG: group 1 truncated hemoglobin [Alphaproteobacteria bacterium CG_4_10_14_0_2_um_filter_63_37]